MAYIVMVDIVMAYIVMAYTVMAMFDGLSRSSTHIDRVADCCVQDWTHKFSPLFEDFHAKRYGFSALLAIMLKQYLFSNLLAWSLLISTCDAESALLIALCAPSPTPHLPD